MRLHKCFFLFFCLLVVQNFINMNHTTRKQAFLKLKIKALINVPA